MFDYNIYNYLVCFFYRFDAIKKKGLIIKYIEQGLCDIYPDKSIKRF